MQLGMPCGVYPLLVVSRTVRDNIRSAVCQVRLIKVCGLPQSGDHTLSSGQRERRGHNCYLLTCKVFKESWHCARVIYPPFRLQTLDVVHA